MTWEVKRAERGWIEEEPIVPFERPVSSYHEDAVRALVRARQPEMTLSTALETEGVLGALRWGTVGRTLWCDLLAPDLSLCTLVLDQDNVAHVLSWGGPYAHKDHPAQPHVVLDPRSVERVLSLVEPTDYAGQLKVPCLRIDTCNASLMARDRLEVTVHVTTAGAPVTWMYNWRRSDVFAKSNGVHPAPGRLKGVRYDQMIVDDVLEVPLAKPASQPREVGTVWQKKPDGEWRQVGVHYDDGTSATLHPLSPEHFDDMANLDQPPQNERAEGKSRDGNGPTPLTLEPDVVPAVVVARRRARPNSPPPLKKPRKILVPTEGLHDMEHLLLDVERPR